MKNDIRVCLFEMIFCISNSVDLIDQTLNNHHLRTAYITLRMVEELGLSKDEQVNAVIAAALHDIGAVSLSERLDTLTFDARDTHIHTDRGWRLLNTHHDFSHIAEIIRHHHTCWEGGYGDNIAGSPVPVASHIIHLADRVAILAKNREQILKKSSDIRDAIRDVANQMFKPELVDVFDAVADSESFWLDLTNHSIGRILNDKFGKGPILDFERLEGIVHLISCIIDYRSRYTATHSAGVVSVAESLGIGLGMSGHDLRLLKIAGYLHDIGKLAVPTEVLEKPGKLTLEEINIIKCHPYWGYYVLDSVKPLQTVNEWAAYHHERIDGKGYPFQKKKIDLPIGSRIIAVADVFTAIKEDRPYRKGLPKGTIKRILADMAKSEALDPEITSYAIAAYDDIASKCELAQREAQCIYEMTRYGEVTLN